MGTQASVGPAAGDMNGGGHPALPAPGTKSECDVPNGPRAGGQQSPQRDKAASESSPLLLKRWPLKAAPPILPRTS